MAHTVIIGAGLTGISTAYHLEQHGITDYKLFEKEAAIGGLCRSHMQDGFTFDFTGHLLHLNDAYAKQLVSSLIGFDHFFGVERRAYIYSHATYTKYPFQKHLHGLPPAVIAQCIEGFARRKPNRKKVVSFPSWVAATFGQGFAKQFFLPFQEKILACDLKKVTASWTGRFVPKTSLTQIIEGAVQDLPDHSSGYNAHFWYPKRGGIASWIGAFAAHIKNPIYTDYELKAIDLRHQCVTFTNGHREFYDQLVSTMPLDQLLNLVLEAPATSFKRAMPKLRCNSVINFNLGISRSDLSEKHWIYFPERTYPFYRLGFPHNFSAASVPPGYSSVYGEFAHCGRSQRWVHNTLQTAIAQTQKLLNIGNQDIATQLVIPMSHAYVIYDFWRERNLPKLLAELQQQSIHSIGRYGAWKYSSMQEAILDGKQYAEQLAQTQRSVQRKIQSSRYSTLLPTRQPHEAP